MIEKIRSLNQNIKEKIMNGLPAIAQRGAQRDIKLGEEVGEQRGFKDAIVRLLSHGMDKAKAAEMLELTLL